MGPRLRASPVTLFPLVPIQRSSIPPSPHFWSPLGFAFGFLGVSSLPFLENRGPSSFYCFCPSSGGGGRLVQFQCEPTAMGSWAGSPGLPRFRPRSLWISLPIVMLHSPKTPKTMSSCIVVFRCLLVVPVVQRSSTSTVECPLVEAAMELWRVVRKGYPRGDPTTPDGARHTKSRPCGPPGAISPSRMAAWGCWKQSQKSLGVTHGATSRSRPPKPDNL